MNDQHKEKLLDGLYATLPRIECKGECAESCGPVFMSRVEWERIKRALSYEPKGKGLTCPMLKDDRCACYAVRPAICRLWGLVPDMPCPFGCTPERYLTRQEAHEFLRAVERIGK